MHGWQAKEGWLTKQGGVRQNWLQRYFLLEEAKLTYFRTVGDRNPQGFIPLTDAIIDHDPLPLKGRPWVLRIETAAPVGGSGARRPGRAFLLQAGSEADFSSWRDAIGCNISLLPTAVAFEFTGVSVDDVPEDGESRDRAILAPAVDTSQTVALLPPTIAAAAVPLCEAPMPSSADGSVAPLPTPGAPASAGSTTTTGIRIWAGTWNMGETQPPSNVGEAWIDRGCDVVAVGLQECMHLGPSLAAIRAYLGPGFLEISHSIGSTSKSLGFHGHIALGVWVREWLVASKICRLSQAVRGSVLLGRNLLLTRAPNKGAVAIALPVRLPDASGALSIPSAFVFISCHLTSDSSGDSRLDARNRNAHEILSQLGLELSDAAIARAASEMQAAGSLDGGGDKARVLPSQDSLPVEVPPGFALPRVGASAVDRDIGASPPSRGAAMEPQLGGSPVHESSAVLFLDDDDEDVQGLLSSAAAPALPPSLPPLAAVPAQLSLSSRQAPPPPPPRLEPPPIRVPRRAKGEPASNRGPRPSMAARVGALYTIDSDSSSSSSASSDDEENTRVRGLQLVVEEEAKRRSGKRSILLRALSSDDLSGGFAPASSIAPATVAVRVEAPARVSARVEPPTAEPIVEPTGYTSTAQAGGRSRRSLSHPLPFNVAKLLQGSSLSHKATPLRPVPVGVAVDAVPGLRSPPRPATRALAGAQDDGTRVSAAVPALAIPLALPASMERQSSPSPPQSERQRPQRRASDVSALLGRGSSSARNLGVSGSRGAPAAPPPSPMSTGRARQGWGAARVTGRDTGVQPSVAVQQAIISGPVRGSRAPLFSQSIVTADAQVDGVSGATDGGALTTGEADGGAGSGKAAHPLRVSASRSYVIMLGDLNYRIRMPPEAALQAICRAGRAVRDSAPVRAAEEPSPWAELLLHEELCSQLSTGAAFPGFDEPPVLFPPSYRRKRSTVPLLLSARGDWANLAAVSQAYATVVGSDDVPPLAAAAVEQVAGSTEAGSLQDAPSRSLRTPSYTDRILVRLPVLAGVPVLRDDFEEECGGRRRSAASNSFFGLVADVGATPISTGVDAAGSVTVVPSTGALDDLGPRRGSGASAAWGDADDDTVAPQIIATERSRRGLGGGERFVPFPVLSCTFYGDCEELLGSDHSAIRAVFELPLKRPAGGVKLTEGPDNAVASAAPIAPFPVELQSPVVLLAAANRVAWSAASGLASLDRRSVDIFSDREGDVSPDATPASGGGDPGVDRRGSADFGVLTRVAQLLPYPGQTGTWVGRAALEAAEEAALDIAALVDASSLLFAPAAPAALYLSREKLEAEVSSGSGPSRSFPLLVPPPYWLAAQPLCIASPFDASTLGESDDDVAQFAAASLPTASLPVWARTAPLFVVPCGARAPPALRGVSPRASAAFSTLFEPPGGISDAVAGSSDAVADSAAAVAGSNDVVADSAAAVAGSADAMDDSAAAVAGSTDAVAESLDGVADSTDTVAHAGSPVASLEPGATTSEATLPSSSIFRFGDAAAPLIDPSAALSVELVRFPVLPQPPPPPVAPLAAPRRSGGGGGSRVSELLAVFEAKSRKPTGSLQTRLGGASSRRLSL